MTYLALCQKLIRDLGLSNEIVTVTGQTGMNKNIVDWIADADEDIQTLWTDWNFLWSQYSAATVASTRESAKPTDLGTWDFDSFYLNYTSDDYIHLTKLEYNDWRNLYRQGTQTDDEPSQFVITPDNNIYLEPVPDGVYTLTADYWKAPTRMTVSASTSDIPDRYQRIIIARAKFYYAEHEEFPEIMQSAGSEYQSLLNRLESAELPGKIHMLKKSQGNDLRVIVE